MNSSLRNWYAPPYWHWRYIGITAMCLNSNWHLGKRNA
jgi:hypothetical protein